MKNEALDRDLNQLAELLRKYGHDGQATVVDEIWSTLDTSTPDYQRLAGIDMWGGAGAVWEVCLLTSRVQRATNQGRGDEKSFREAIIRTAAEMDRLGIGTARSPDIAKTFPFWIDKGL